MINVIKGKLLIMATTAQKSSLAVNTLHIKLTVMKKR